MVVVEQSDVIYTEPSAGNVQPYIHLEAGESLVKIKAARLTDKYYLGFAPESLLTFLQGPPIGAQLLIWAASHLILNTNLVADRLMEHQGPRPRLATFETLQADLGRSQTSVYRDLHTAQELDLWLTFKVGGATHFWANPRIVWRGNVGQRPHLLELYDRLRDDPDQDPAPALAAVIPFPNMKTDFQT